MIRSSVDHNLYTQRLDEIIGQLNQNSDQALLQVTFPFTEINLLQLLKAANQETRQFYFSRPDENSVFASLGSLIQAKISGTKRFREAERFYHLWKNKTFFVREDSSEANPEQYFLLQSSFFPEIKQGVWDGFSPLMLYIPEFIFQKENGHCTISINLFVDGPVELADLNEQLENKQNRIKKIVSLAKQLKRFNGTYQTVSSHPVSYDHWQAIVERGIESIHSESFKKVVLSTNMQLASRSDFDVHQIAARLEEQYPNCTCFIMRSPEGKTFLGATPEEFVKIESRDLHCDALAGSMSRGESEYEEEQLGQQLLESPKNRSEHQYVVDYLKQTLQALVTELSYPVRPSLMKLSNVQHLYTPFAGLLQRGVSVFDVIDRLHPTPAVGGIPVGLTVDFITQHENYERGYYASPLGILTSSGDLDLVVGLRSGLFHKNKGMLFAGAGIVADSDPSTEYDEIMMKFQPLLTAIQPQDLHAESLES